MSETATIESRVAHCREREADDYPYVVHGVAQAAGELTNGLNGPKYWPAAELRAAAPTLEGAPVYSVHEGDRREVGRILDAAYDEQHDAVVYEAGLEDAAIGEALSIGEREPTIEAGNPDTVDRHEETGAVIMRGFEYTGMATTEQGASDASYAAPGPADQNPAVAALSAGVIEATLADASADDDDDELPITCRECGERERTFNTMRCPACHPDMDPDGEHPPLATAPDSELEDWQASLATLDDLAAGDVVSWRTGNGTLAYGKVRATIQRGEFDTLLSTDRVVRAPAILIGVYAPGQGNEWSETNRLVARKPESVTRHEDFPAAPAREGALAEATLQDTPYELTNVTTDEITADDGPGFTDDPWDGDDVVASLPNPSASEEAPDVLDRTMALVPADDDTRDAKSNWKAPFRSGPDAPVNTRALVAIDAAISGARGGFEGVADEVLADLSDWTQSLLDAAPDDLFGADDAEAAAASVALMAATHPDDPMPDTGTGEGLGSGDGESTTKTTSTDDQPTADPDSDMGDTPDDPDDRIAELEAKLEAKTERIAELEAQQHEDLEAELEAAEERVDELEAEIAELEEENEALQEQNEAARERYAAALAEADTLLSEEELAEKYTLAELAAKAEEADFSTESESSDPVIRSGGGEGVEANLSETEQERKQEIEARLSELEDTDGFLAEKEQNRLEAELAELTGGEA